MSVVDVPGHERFVRTMVAGATGIDCFLMVVAADDGVMPQTVEHAAVLRALGVTPRRRRDHEGRPRRPGPRRRRGARRCSATASSTFPARRAPAPGVEDVRAAIGDVVAGLDAGPRDAGGPILHVDRAFTIRGAGTVVTGTLWSGTVRVGDRLAVLPAGTPARVRGVQVHDQPVERAGRGPAGRARTWRA